jgi:hypothetical protein
LIHRCRADIPLPTLLIGVNVVNVVPRVRNLVLNERLTSMDHFRKVCQKIYWIKRSLRPHAAHTPVEVRRRLVLSHVNYGNILFTGAESASQRRLGVAFKAFLRYIHMRRRVDHVSHLELTVTGTLLVHNASIQLMSFLYTAYGMFAILFICFILPHCTLAMVAMSQPFVVLICRAWNFLPHDVKRLPMHGRFVSALKGMYRSA